MRIAVGSDHAGFNLKQEVIELLRELGHQVYDAGTYSAEPSDYPDFAAIVGRAVAEGRADAGILICGTGVGMSIAANKIKGVRAAACYDIFTARMAREHNDANILCLGAWVVGKGVAFEIVKTFLNAKFSEVDRHYRRIAKIKALEEEQCS
ncbi:MAG: ribose 5-phosphate isomerase B [Anaerolineae bacterium]|nr:ribose 5-phosphate isomerase B [Anaerolineae bacterium]MDW8102306.1 ribose 5-phosphate isomerase B [Anaerolineae bacterium]